VRVEKQSAQVSSLKSLNNLRCGGGLPLPG
jgi:hypothetical protein